MYNDCIMMTTQYEQADNWEMEFKQELCVSVVDETFRNIYSHMFCNLVPQLTEIARKMYDVVGISAETLEEVGMTLDDVKKYVDIDKRATATKHCDIQQEQHILFKHIKVNLKLHGSINNITFGDAEQHDQTRKEKRHQKTKQKRKRTASPTKSSTKRRKLSKLHYADVSVGHKKTQKKGSKKKST